MFVLRVAMRSLLNRRLATCLTLASIALSVALLIGVERIRNGAREGFTNTISKTDLIVGARGGTVQLLLYAVFRIGTATNNLSYASYERIRSQEAVAWTIPYSLGDSHRGFRVVATTPDFYEHYRYRGNTQVKFKTGQPASGVFDVVLGHAVAKKLGYKVEDRIVLSHGISDVSFQKHEDKPFKIVGILEPTATPIDRSLYITLQGMEAIHIDWTDGAPPLAEGAIAAATLSAMDNPLLQPHRITAFLVGLKSRTDVLRMQRAVNEDKEEALMAIIPGAALSELWDGISYAEDGLRVVSGFVIVVGLLGMLVSIYNSLNERRREMAILRSVGAGPGVIFSLLILESFLLTAVGSLIGVAAMYGLLFVMQPWIEASFGLYVPIKSLQSDEIVYLSLIWFLGLVLGAVPAWTAYRNSLHDGLTIRI